MGGRFTSAGAVAPAGDHGVSFDLAGSGSAAFQALVAKPRRRGFSFFGARRAACITQAGGLVAVELFQGSRPPGHAGLDLGLTLDTQVDYLAVGLVGLCHPAGDGFAFTALVERSGEWTVRRLGAVRADRAALVPSSPGDRWQLAFLGDDDTTDVWRLDWEAATATAVARLDGLASGGAWIDRGRLAFNLAAGGRGTSGHLLDLRTGECRRIFEVSPDSDDRIVATHRNSRVAVTSDAFGYRRVGLGRLGSTVRFLADFPTGDVAGQPWSFTSGGAALVLTHQMGVQTRLLLADTTTLEVETLPMPFGVAGFPVAATGDLLRFPFSTPSLPVTCARLDLTGRRFALEEPARPAGRTARPVSFATRGGRLEALVYGRPDDATPLAVALHRGPFNQWAAGFNIHCQMLAGLGWTVAAVNYPGSTGYGRAGTGSPGRAGPGDVDAVAAVARALGAQRRPVLLFGESYGAQLALRVASAHPGLVAGIVALSPSGPELGARAGAGLSAPCPVLVVHDDVTGGPPLLRLRAQIEAIFPA